MLSAQNYEKHERDIYKNSHTFGLSVQKWEIYKHEFIHTYINSTYIHIYTHINTYIH